MSKPGTKPDTIYIGSCNDVSDSDSLVLCKKCNKWRGRSRPHGWRGPQVVCVERDGFYQVDSIP